MIPFNKPYLTGKEHDYVLEAYANGHLSGDGHLTSRCAKWLEEATLSPKVLLTPSCTAALEMAAILAGIGSGDEVIMPSYTFVSTANAFVLRGGVPVFIDIREDTLNMDERLIESAITPRTRAIVPVHYAGVACNMDSIMKIASKHNLIVIEDAAQGVMSSYKGRALGSIADLGCYSFHETKNISTGEGGALLINNPLLIERAEIIREKGTDRSKFFRGQVDKYRWVDIGSSYLPSEITAAFLWAQLEEAISITELRMFMWNRYHEAFSEVEKAGLVRRPTVGSECIHNAHMYYLILKDVESREMFIKKMRASGVSCIFHYVPLHLAPFSVGRTRVHGHLHQTEKLADRLVRLPIWVGLNEKLDVIIDAAHDSIGAC
jgi:dTDP-4-amino-4,6-dideoxygalactose transaminase